MNKTRFEAFSDGVFAIVITLLAIELRPFKVDWFGDLLHVVPDMLLFVLGFVSVAVFWINHHYISHLIEEVTNKILWANNLALLFVTLIPFATGMLGMNLQQVLARALYSLVMFLAAVMFLVLRYFVHKDWKADSVKRSMIGPLMYLLSVPAMALDPRLFFVFIAVPPIYYLYPKKSK